MESQWAMSRAPEPRQRSRRSTSAMKPRSSRWIREARRCDPSTASISSSSLYPSCRGTRTSFGRGGGDRHSIEHMFVSSTPPRARLLLGLGGSRGLIRRPSLHIQPIRVGGLQPRALHLVAAREGLDLTTRGLLFAEVDRDQGAFAADRTGDRTWIGHRQSTVHSNARGRVASVVGTNVPPGTLWSRSSIP